MAVSTRFLQPLAEVIFLVATAAWAAAQVSDIDQARKLAAERNVTCILVFGDSSVDPGNNNRLRTTNKGNFRPYGMDFLNGRPTGRFTNGRLATDFIAEFLGYKKFVKGFLDPHLTEMDLLHGVSFASAGSGYDDLTANLTSVISLTKQLKYLEHYKIHLRRLVGVTKAEEIINNAVFIVSMGTNDFLLNYFLQGNRSQEHTLDQYQDFLISRLSNALEEMHHVGARRVVVVSVPPLGCAPLVRTIQSDTAGCDVALNKVAFSFASNLKNQLDKMKKSLGIKISFLDIYTKISGIVDNPNSYGFTEASKGCCGSGTLEFGESCRGLNTCPDRTKYVFWDAVHFTERVYKILADEALKTIFGDI